MTVSFLEEQLLLIAILVTVTAVVVLVEHLLFGRMWKGNELARRVMGHATILVIIGIPAMLGYLDFMTWLMVTVVTFVAGGLVGAIEVTEQERRRAVYVQELREWAEHQAENEEGTGDGTDREH